MAYVCKMNFLKVFFSLIIKNIFSIETILVHGPFFLCDQTETIIEMPNNCQDLSTFEMIKCEMFKNDLQIFSKFDDQFNFADSTNGQIIIYSLYRNVYLASCTSIEEVSIPEKVDECTKDIPVLVSADDKIVYLTKEGILRRHSDIISCSNEYEFFETHNDNVQIVRQNNLIATIEKKRNNFGGLSDSELSKMNRFIKDFLEFYRKYFSTNERFLIFRDFSLLLLLFIVVITIIFKSKKPIKDLLLFFGIIQKFNNPSLTNGNVESLGKLETNANSVKYSTSTNLLADTKQSEQKIGIEKEVFDLKSLKKVSSSIDVIVDSIEKNSNNVTKRNEVRNNENKEHCNCKSGCVNNHCPCKQNKKLCNALCHSSSNCSNLNKL